MSGAAVLQRRYRHWLGLFPAAHRAVHGEEMLGVLMAGARTGQHRPRLADAADLAWGALRIRLRPSPAAPWSDALAVVSVLLPLLVLVNFAARNWDSLSGLPPGSFRPMAEFLGKSLVSWVLVCGLVLLRLRRTAALAVTALLVWQVLAYSGGGQVNETVVDPLVASAILTLVLEAVTLAASPGPRRGLQILRARHYGFTVAVAAGSGLTASLMTGIEAIRATELAIVAVTAAGMVIAAPLSRRILVLLSLPLYYWALSFAVLPSWITLYGGGESGWEGPLRVSLTCVPVAVLGCIALTAGLRARGWGLRASGRDRSRSAIRETPGRPGGPF
jgi:hypothetical protein